MAYKETQSSSITTTTIGSKTRTSSSTTTSKRRLTRGEASSGILTTIGQLQMIGISIFVISIGTAATQFSKTDLIAFTPNYTLTNTYQSVDNPLEHYNYIPYGQDVLYSLVGFVEFLEPFGRFAQDGWTFILRVVSPDITSTTQPTSSFFNTFGADRVLALSQMRFATLRDYYNELTSLERQWIKDNVDSTHYGSLEQGFYQTRWYLMVFIDGRLEFFYTEKSVYQYIMDLGVGT
jgi:hypothetical protein